MRALSSVERILAVPSLSPQCLPSYVFSAYKDKEKSTGGLVCFQESVKLKPGGVTYFQCPTPQLHQGCFSPRASVHSLRELVDPNV